MDGADLHRVALGLLPALPCQVVATREDGGRLALELREHQDGRFYCHIDDPKARAGLSVRILVRTPDGGGYSVEGRIEKVYFIGGLESAALLAITDVRRRKPFRTSTRQPSGHAATIQLGSTNDPGACRLDARVIDISKTGIGITTATRLSIGDHLSLQIHLSGEADLTAEATVVRSAKASFGRWQAGCEFTHLPQATQHAIESLAISPAA